MKTWSTYIILAAFVLAGCSDEISDNPVRPPVIPDEDGTVALTIQFPNSGIPNTYAYTIDADEENKIYNLHVLSFTHNSSSSASILDDQFAYRLEVAPADIADSTTSNIKKAIKVKVKNMVELQRLVLVANVPSTVNLTTVCTPGRTMAAIIDDLKFSGADWRTETGTASFPMFGQMTDSVQFHSLNTTNPVHKLTFNMIRAVARVDVGVDLYNKSAGDPALGFGDIFKIQNVYVYNASDRGYIAPHDDYLKHKPDSDPPNDKVDTVLSKVNLVSGDQRATFPVAFPTSGNILERSIYLPESGVLNGSYTPAFLVIEATYYGDTYFYRIDFTKNNDYVPVLRNHNYVFNITGIRSPGYLKLDSAIIAPVSRFGALELDKSSDIGLKEVISYNNEYYLAFSSTHLDVKPDGAQRVKIYVKSSYKNGFWEASDQSWSAGNGYTSLYRNSASNSQAERLDSIEFVVGINNTGLSRDFTFNVKAGMLTQKITVTQSPGSNSYIVKPNGGSSSQTFIPIKSANADGGNRIQSDVPITQLWASSPSLSSQLKLSNVAAGAVYVWSDGTATGNAVIAAKDGSGKILYSWHIWVTDYNPDSLATQKSNNGFIFMDRNLGAMENTTTPASYGLYYQWGRKDPFTPGHFSVGMSDPYANYLEWAIQHPDTFYAVPYTSSLYNWAGTGGHNSMWSTMDGKKGPYDPCPFGWRVPVVKDEGSGSPWYGATGHTVNRVEYPLAGYLDGFSGTLEDATTGGGVWGATAKGPQAYLYKFDVGGTSYFRASGYPVRCVKDTR
jgi:hypothetical protein